MAVSKKIADLFYEVRAQTSGFEADLKSAEKSAERLGSYIKAHPVAAAGALGAALIGVAYQAKQMAAEVEKGMRVVEQTVPGATARIGELRNEIRQMSLDGPHTQAQLAATAAEIGRQGVASLDELKERLHAATRAADATGADVNNIVGGMDQVFDLFGDRIGTADEVMQQLWATARGRAPLDEVFAAIQGAAPAVRNFGIDFNTATRALGALLDEGLTAKKAASELDALAKQGAAGAVQIRKLAESYDVAAGSREAYNEAIRKGRESEEASWQTIKNNLNVVLLDLGSSILPLVNNGLKWMLGYLQELTGAASDRRLHSALEDLATFGADAKNTSGTRRADLVRAAQGARGASGDDLAKQSLADLIAMQKGLAVVLAASSDAERAAYDGLRQRIHQAIGAAQALEAVERRRTDVNKDKAKTAAQVEAEEKARVAAMVDAADASDKKLRRMADVMGDISKAIGSNLQDWETTSTRAAANLADLHLEAQAYIATLLGDTLKQAELDLEARLAKLRGAAAEADRRGDTKGADQLRADAEAIQRAANEAARLRKETEAFDRALYRAGGNLQDVGNAAKGVTATTSDAVTKAREHARVLSEAVRGALDLADAFGVIDDRTASMLRNVVQVVANIGPLREVLKDKKASAGDVIGAALPVVGGVAQLVSSFGNASRAMEAAAIRLQDAVRELSESLDREARSTFANDAERRRMDLDDWFRGQLQQIYDRAREGGKELGSGFLGASPENLRPTGFKGWEWIDALIEQLKQIGEDRLRKLQEELAREREQLEASLAVRSLRARGLDDEADLLELEQRQREEQRQWLQSGLFAADSPEFEAARRTQEEERQAAERRIAERRQREEEERRRTVEDLTARQLTAEGRNREAEDARRAAAARRELAEATDPVIRAMIELAIAAEEAAIAAERQAAAQRALEDLQVRLLRAQGNDPGADNLAFDLAQRRELEEAIKNEMSQEYIDLLKEVQAAERARRANGATAASATATAAAAVGSGVSSATLSNVQNITLTQADRIVGYLGTIAHNSHELAIIRAALAGTRAPQITPPNLPSSFTVGAGGQVIQNRITITLNFYGPVTGGRDAGRAIGDGILRQMNAGFGAAATLAPIATGDVSR